MSMLIVSYLCNGQSQDSNEYKDVVYLKNGSQLYGSLQYYNPADSVVLVIKNGHTMTFRSSMVRKILMDNKGIVDVYTGRSNTWYTRTQFSVLYTKDNGGLSLTQSVGYQYSHWLSMGIGLGIDNFIIEKGNNLYPLFGELKVGLMKRNKTPYVGTRFGYAFAFAQEDLGQTYAKGGFFINPVIGYRMSSNRPFMDVFCGMRFQDVTYKTIDSWGKNTYDITYNRYDIGVALTF